MFRSLFKMCGLILFAGLLSVGAGRSFAQTTPCGTTSWTLWAGQHINVGTLTVENDNTNLYVTYKLDDLTQPDASFGTLHLWVGTDLTLVDGGGVVRPSPGQLPYHFDATGLREHTFTIPFATIPNVDGAPVCPLSLYVVAHAEVEQVKDENGSLGGQTAFGGDTPGPGRAWWFYAKYSVCCDSGPPPIRTCQTAFGKGGWIFTTDPKSNPAPKLPTLGLTKNRWGWAINRTIYGATTHDIWAGAGLNKTSNGTRVGTLSVSWNGTKVTVTYTLFAPFDMEELHIYAGDLKPTTVAPGQYGYIEYFDPPATTHEATFDVSDTNADGIWVIAHAVVCAAQQN